jgi:hypothetical protein
MEEGFTVVAAQCQLRAVGQPDNIVSVKERAQSSRRRFAHNGRAVNADEIFRIEAILQALGGLSGQVVAVRGMNDNVLVRRLDPQDFVDRDEDDSLVLFDRNSRQPLLYSNGSGAEILCGGEGILNL